MDYITIINLILSVAILILGIKRFMQSGVKAFIFIGLGFLLFGVSHVAVLMGWAGEMKTVLSAVRIGGYFMVIIGMLL
jgi:hypothetical protein